MAIANMCKHDVVSIEKNASIQEAAKLMKEKNVGSLVVFDNKNPVGIVTDRDIVIKLLSEKTDLNQIKIEQVMSENLLILQANQGIKEVMNTMKEKGVRRAPIIENEKICGMVSLDDLVLLFINELSDVAQLVKKQMNGEK